MEKIEKTEEFKAGDIVRINFRSGPRKSEHHIGRIIFIHPTGLRVRISTIPRIPHLSVGLWVWPSEITKATKEEKIQQTLFELQEE